MSVELTNLDHHVQVIRTKVFNLSKWLTVRNDALRHLKHSKIDNASCNEREFQSLLDEARRQHSVLNLIIIRGHRLLSYEKNALLEADLENLVCLWNSFEDNLHCLCGFQGSAEKNCSLNCSHFKSSELNSDFEIQDSKEKNSFGLKLLQKHISKKENTVESLCTTYIDRKESNTCSSDVDTIELSIDSSEKDETDSLKSAKFFSLSSEFAHLSKLFGNLENGINVSTFQDSQIEDEKPELSCVNYCFVKSIASESTGLKMSFDGSQNSLVEDDQVVPGSLVRKLSGDPMSSFPTLKILEPVSCEILEAKRRRLLMDAANVSDISSRSESPLSFNSSRSETPTGTLTRADRSHELWKAIGSIDSFLMDKDIIEACKSTAGDLSCDAEDFAGAPNVSFTEFLQQYRELNDWLNQVHKVTQREITSLSEKYLNQSYHEEILERSPRREFLNNYSHQLLLRYPNMMEPISSRMSRLNSQWAELEQAIAPKHSTHDADTMLQDLECDLESLRRWVVATETRLLSLTIKADWSTKELEERLLQHQTLQKEIESRNKIVNAVLKLSDKLEHHSQCQDSLKQVALALERRWHGIWLQSLEWQYRLEEALANFKGSDPRRFDLSGFSLHVLDESLFGQLSPDISDDGLIQLDDDSLLFIGRREDYVDSSSGVAYKSFDVTGSSHSSGSLSLNADESIEDFSTNLLLEEEALLHSERSSSKNSTEPSSPTRSLGLLKPESPLGKRPFPGPRSCESSPAKKGSQSPVSSSGGLSPIAQESPLESFIISRGYHLHSRENLLINSRDELTSLKLRKNLFDRSSGDSANISETESKMGDSPPVDNLGRIGYVLTSSDGEVDVPPVRRLISAEIKDIGYSSESQSNDEVEVMGHQIDMEYKFPGKCELASDGPLGDKVTLPSTAVNPDYYYMTHVDVDSTDKTDNGDTTDSGAEKVLKKNCVKKSTIQNGYLKEIKSESVGEVLTQSDSFEASINEVLSELDSSKECNQLDDAWDAVDGTLALINYPAENERFCALFPNSEDSDMLPMHHYIEFSESDSAPESREKKSIKYLIEHAEDLVKPPSTSPQHSSKKSLSPKKLPQTVVSHPSPSKQTQTDCCSTVESSCDASGEDNSDHEGIQQSSSVMEDFSTATDDAEETLFNSVINLESAKNASADDITKPTPHGSPVLDSARLRKQTGERKPHYRGKKDRPWSVVGLQEYAGHRSKSDGCCLQQVVAASESAIDHLHFSTDTDSSSPFHPNYHASTFPRDKHNIIFNKSYSCSEQQTSPAPRVARRKISYPTVQQMEENSLILNSDCYGLQFTNENWVPQTGSPTRMSSCQNETLSASDHSPAKSYKARRLRKRSSLEKPSVISSLSKSSTTDSYDSAEAESESETTDDYVTAPMEAATSDGDDIHNISGTLSEHSAWDNYQALYPTASEDPGEELINWEPQDELEYDDDFQLSKQRRSIVTAVMGPKRSKLKFTKQGMPGDDSDSDLEDFHHILEQSELSLRLADQSLRKRRKDPMGTGLHPDPAKYEEIIATYETNMLCLQNVLFYLKSDHIPETDVVRIKAIMSQWEKLNKLACERHQQTKQLGVIRDRLSEIHTYIQQSEAYLCFDRFTSSDELKTTIATLKKRNQTIESQSDILKSLTKDLHDFSACYPTVCLDKYHQEISALQKAAHNMAEKVSDHVNTLSNNREIWLEYLDNQQELDMLLAQDRERLHSMLCQREFGMRLTKKDVLIELEKLQSNLSLYESKLSVLQAIKSRLTKTSDSKAQRTLLAALADLRNQLLVVSERCQKVYRDVEEDEDLPLEQTDLGKLAVSAASLHEAFKNPQHQRLLEETEEVSSCMPSSNMCISRTCASWLRSLPVQVVALMLVAGLVCVLDPDIIDRLTSFRVRVSPELHYVNGPPTI